MASHTRTHTGPGFIRPVYVTIFAAPESAVATIHAMFVAITNLHEGFSLFGAVNPAGLPAG